MSSRHDEVLEVAGREVRVTNPRKVYFPAIGLTKLQLVRYYLAVADAALRGVAGRPIVLKRYVDGADQPAFYQKRAPENRPSWMETAELRFPSGRAARELVLRDAAQLAWIVNLGCIDLHPHPVRAADLEHPDELRIDLDPVPGVSWPDIVQVALLARDVLMEHGLTAFGKTSGSRGFHVYARVEPRWSFVQLRRAALAVAREVERRAPAIATSRWWKEERRGVFLDYNQNAKDRTTASAYSVRPTSDARVSTPLGWDEVLACDPAAFTVSTVPGRLAARGDPWARMDAHAGSLEPLLELSRRHEAEGLGDAPWPPHFAKQADEPKRVQPSRAASEQAAPHVASPQRAGRRAVSERGACAAQPSTSSPTKGGGRRQPTKPLVTVAQAARRADALAGLERWKERHPVAASLLRPADVLVDSMRGRSSTWTRVRVNLEAVPEDERPAQEAPDPDYDPWG